MMVLVYTIVIVPQGKNHRVTNREMALYP